MCLFNEYSTAKTQITQYRHIEIFNRLYMHSNILLLLVVVVVVVVVVLLLSYTI